MISRRLLYLNAHRLAAYAWQQGRLVAEGEFEAGVDDLERFAGYLAGRRQSRYYLLANVAEEGHVLESIPFLRGSDRQALISRKIGQHFLGTRLATAISLGYEKTTRKNEKLLISALTNPGHFDPWLQRINAAEVPLAGIYTVAQLGGLLLRKLGHHTERCLLLTLQDHSIRESFLVNGQVYFSRMAPLGDSSIAGIASAFAVESGKLQQYLIGQRLIGRDETLPVFIVAHPLAIPAIEQACAARPQFSFFILDSLAAASKLQLKTLATDSRSDNLFLHLLATAAPAEQFANDIYRHDFRLQQIRQALLGFSVVSVLGSLLFSAHELYESRTLREETLALSSAESDFNWRYQEITATFPKLEIDNDTLRRLTGRYAGLRQHQRQPGPAFRLLGRALDEMPAIQPESIDWKIGNAGPPAKGIAGDGEEKTTLRASIHLPPGTSPRQTLGTLEQFVGRLRNDPANTVNVIQQPVDIESGRPLRGGDTEEHGAQPRQFTVEITRKIGP